MNAYDFCDCLVKGQTITLLLESNPYVHQIVRFTSWMNRFFDWGHFLVFIFNAQLTPPEFEEENKNLLDQIEKELKHGKVIIISAGYQEVIIDFFQRKNFINIENLEIIANTMKSPRRMVKGETKKNYLNGRKIDNFYTDSYEDISCREVCESLIQVKIYNNDVRFKKE